MVFERIKNWWKTDPRTGKPYVVYLNETAATPQDECSRREAKLSALREEWNRVGKAEAEERFKRNVALAEAAAPAAAKAVIAVPADVAQVSGATQEPAATKSISFIYLFLNVETGRFKIGKTNNVQSRFRQLSTASSERLLQIYARSVPAAKVFRIEKRIHVALNDHHPKANGQRRWPTSNCPPCSHGRAPAA